MNTMIVKEMLQLIEIGLKSDLKSEKHSCLHRLAYNFNLLVSSPVINLNEIKLAARGPMGLDSLRINMKSLLLSFNQTVKNQAKKATSYTKEKVEMELEKTARSFAAEYGKLQREYMDLLFQQDLEKMIGKGKAELFAKFRMMRNAENN